LVLCPGLLASAATVFGQEQVSTFHEINSGDATTGSTDPPHSFTSRRSYYWLRDDERDDPKVLGYLQQEQQYTEAKLAHTRSLQHTLFTELTERLQPDDHSVPYFKSGYWYVREYQVGQDYPRFTRWQYAGDTPELLLDCTIRAAEQDYYALAAVEVSPNQRLLAFAEDTLSRRLYAIRIKNLDTGELYPEVIDNTSGNLVWAADNRTLFYVRKDPQSLQETQVFRHTLGMPVSDDQLVYQESDDAFSISLYQTTSEAYVVIGSFSSVSSEIWLIDASHPERSGRRFSARRRGHEYSVDHWDGHFYVRSNRDGANFGLYRLDQDRLEEDDWQTVLAPGDEVLLEGFALFRDWLVVEQRSNGLTQLLMVNRHSGERQPLQFDDSAYTTWLHYNPEGDSSKLRYGYSSMTTPDTVYELDMDSGERRVLKQDKVLGDFVPARYQSERIWVSARDGVKVPISLVYRKDLFHRDGSNPILLYGYGSYGASMDPDFSDSRLSLLDRGFVYAIAHIRGGEELGRDWYEQGKLLKKMNTFTDFIDVTRALVHQGYADRERVFAMGGSAGGLLMGAVVNMAPELYKGVVAAVPFVDVVTTMLDESIPLTTEEYDEWGNPNDPDYYAYMKSYCPYDQVRRQVYPHMLVTTGLYDSQVQYWEPAKWVAKLREMKLDNNLLLLDVDMNAGHGGKSGRLQRYHDTARELAFILDLAGIES